METEFKNLSVSQPTLAPKQPPGARGQEYDVKTNLIKLGLKPNIPFYKYDVRIYVIYVKDDGTEVLKELTKQARDDYCEQERKSGARSIYKKLLKDQAAFFGNGFSLYYDRAAILFSMKQLQVGSQKQFDLPKGYIPGHDEASSFRVVIKQAADTFQTSTNEISKVNNARPREADKTILEVLNLIAGQVPLMSPDFITYGNGTHYLFNPDPKVFSRDDVPSLPDGKYTGVGCSKSVKVLSGNGSPAPFMTLDIKKTAFHIDDQPLLQKIEDLAIFRGRFTIEEACKRKKQIALLFKNLTVMTTYGKPQVFPISGFSDHNANEIKFDFNGKKITLAQYFATKYKIHLKAPQLFLVVGRFGPKIGMFPIELLKVAPNQRVIGQQQTPEQISKMGVANPRDRYRQTEAMLKTINVSNDNEYMKQAGMTSEQQFTMVKARILPPPQIKLADATAQVERNCKWNPKGKFACPAQLRKWLVVGMIAPGRDAAPAARLQEYITHLVRIGNSKGMSITQPQFSYCTQPSEGEVMKYMKQAKDGGMQLVFFISSDRITLHNYIKKEEALINEFVTQEVKLSKVLSVLDKKQFQTLENVAMKMNSKLGGLSKNVILGPDAKTQAWLNDPKRLFIGFEFSHPAPLTKSELQRGETYRTPSVVGYGANSGKHVQYFLGDFKYIEAHQPEALENELQNIFDTVIRQFRANRNIIPTHLVCYFNGISEGQFGLVAGRYLDLIRKACTNISDKFKPSMTLIAAMKTHNERLYNKVISGNNATDQNIPAGVVVDKTIVSGSITEFYLNAHCAFKGTAKTPKYSVLYDDTKMPSDVIQGMTHGLCFLHDIVNATVSVPAPLIVADRCAKRGANNFAEIHGSENGVIDIERANSLLAYKGKKLSNVRYNA